MSEIVELYRRAVDQFDGLVAQIRDDQWSSSTPCTDWDVRALVNHVVYEDLWMPPLLAGKTIEDVGDRFEGEVLGDDPHRAWKDAAESAVSASGEDGVLERTVHLSFGDVPGREYVSQVLTDHVIHAWDLARGIGAKERLEPELVDFAKRYLEPQAEAWRAGGAFGQEVKVPSHADTQTKLLALTGRKA
ncbi:MAG TPA: TIGR03086 family metal-binding protein [Actinomycetota bacterium]